jgi:hypothetical protein
MKEFLGKFAHSKNDKHFSIITAINEEYICPGFGVGIKYDEFDSGWEFTNEEDQKMWNEFYTPLKAKELLKTPKKIHTFGVGTRKIV